jgi:hypothetical protein
METFVGLDVSLKETSVCVLNQTGALVFEGKVVSEPKAISRLMSCRWRPNRKASGRWRADALADRSSERFWCWQPTLDSGGPAASGDRHVYGGDHFHQLALLGRRRKREIDNVCEGVIHRHRAVPEIRQMSVCPGELAISLLRRHMLYDEKIERSGKSRAIRAAFAMEEQRPRRGLQYPLKCHDIGVGQFTLRRKCQIDMGKAKG